MPPLRRRPRAGFTLVELMVVVVIIGVLAAMAMPKFANTTAKADLANVRSDLHALAVAQEDYYYEHAVYAPDLARLKLQPSPGVTLTVVEAGSNGWSATAAHAAAAPVRCAAYYGGATPLAPAAVEGVITCR